jgi:precorrin-3B C17-methyltransferase
MGKLYIVGIGSGNYEDLTIKASNVLKLSDLIYCDEISYQKLVSYFDKVKFIKNSYKKTEERYLNAINSCMQNKVVSILGGGDPGIYGVTSLLLEYLDKLDIKLDIEIIPGITSAISGASLLGSPISQDFAVMTLSDNLARHDQLKEKIQALASTNFSIVFYSPHNSTYENLIFARDLLLSHRSPKTVVGLVKNIGTNSQQVIITNLENMNINDIDSYTTIFIGNRETKISKTKKMITPLL